MRAHVLLAVIWHYSKASKLDIWACCNADPNSIAPQIEPDSCQLYERAEQLQTVDCCGHSPYDTHAQICCDGFIRMRYKDGKIANKCCGNQVLNDDETCCEGTIHKVQNGECCGEAVYLAHEKAFLCCNGSLARIVSENDICCGQTTYDGGIEQICCNNRVFDKEQYDSCCPTNQGHHEPYKTSKSLCCDGASPRGTAISCCYVREAGRFKPHKYDVNKQCCKYPFDKLYPKPSNGSCTDSRL